MLFKLGLGPRVVFSYITIVIMTIFIAVISLYEEINVGRSGLKCNMGLVVYDMNCRQPTVKKCRLLDLNKLSIRLCYSESAYLSSKNI